MTEEDRIYATIILEKNPQADFGFLNMFLGNDATMDQAMMRAKGYMADKPQSQLCNIYRCTEKGMVCERSMTRTELLEEHE